VLLDTDIGFTASSYLKHGEFKDGQVVLTIADLSSYEVLRGSFPVTFTLDDGRSKVVYSILLIVLPVGSLDSSGNEIERNSDNDELTDQLELFRRSVIKGNNG